MPETTITPTQPSLDGCPLPLRTRVYVIKQRQTVNLNHTFELNGAPYAVPADTPVMTYFRESVDDAGQVYSIPTTVVTGLLHAIPPPDWVGENLAGVYALEFAMMAENLPTSLVQASDRAWLVVEPSFAASHQAGRLPTLDDIRGVLRDQIAAENPLHGDREFTDGQIVGAMVRMIRDYNATAPHEEVFSSLNFPWPHELMHATIAQLYLDEAHRLRRNRVAATGAGITADVMNRADTYAAEAKEMMAAWREFKTLTKMSKHARNPVVIHGSSFAGSNYSRW